MTPAHFLRLVSAELRCVFGRWSGKGALILAVVIPLIAGLAMNRAIGAADEAVLNGMPASSFLDMTWRGVLDWSLTARNFFIMSLLLVLASASTTTGELADNSLREAILRPVPRWSVLVAKLLALAALSAATLALTFLLGVGTGAAVAGTEAELGKVALGYVASFFSDVGLMALTLLAGVFLRSVGMVVVVVILFLIVDWAGGLGLSGLGALGVDWARDVSQFRPGHGLAVWDGWKGADGFDSSAMGALAILFTVGFGGALARFQRMDVP